ncbi:flagellar export chaperone FliS [Patulibacter brassicae]|uniref:Flagellar export chaperone FliS n=1 Tax=Patulibacter brassicae TaxID=1705717 RepID=A0ABU4VMY7_9ACTN|nr:flagellar export chaperone FliS [Patulibacter brassicae]MDX8153207.1 flagellar export chaperone FliS [Patulibacter brassicae]
MSTYAAPNAYRDGAVLTASPVGLVVLLYDGIGRFLRQAAAALEAGDTTTASARMQRAEAIISELVVTLDHERGGEIAARLEAIYLFWRRHLDAARIERDPAKVLDIVRQAAELRQAYAAIGT